MTILDLYMQSVVLDITLIARRLQAGMINCANWLKTFITEVPVEFVATAPDREARMIPILCDYGFRFFLHNMAKLLGLRTPLVAHREFLQNQNAVLITQIEKPFRSIYIDAKDANHIAIRANQ